MFWLKNKNFGFAIKASPHYGPTQVRSIIAPYFIYHNNLKESYLKTKTNWKAMVRFADISVGIGHKESLLLPFLCLSWKLYQILLAIMATFLGDNAGSKIGNMIASRELPCSWRNNNLSSRRRVSKRGPKAARRDQYGPISSCFELVY